MTKEKIMTAEDYREFGKMVGVPIKTGKNSEEDGTFNSDNEYLTIIGESDFKNSIQKLYYHKPNVIGLCCGSTPRHINELTKLTKEIRAI